MRLLKIILVFLFFGLFLFYLPKKTTSQEPKKAEGSAKIKISQGLNSADSALQISREKASSFQRYPAKILRKQRNTRRISGGEIDKKSIADKRSVQSSSMPGWVTIMSEDFEGVFPNSGWDVFDDNGFLYGEYYWDDDYFRPYEGNWSAWCASGGLNGCDPPYCSYPDSCESWMVYGPFSLKNAIDAELLFYWWLWSEPGRDKLYWMASPDDYWYYGESRSGKYGGFNYGNFDLTNVYEIGNLCGRDSVWIAFIFLSNISITDTGAFVDNIVLRKNAIYPDLIVQRITPSNYYPTRGDTITVDMVIKNQGTADANNFDVGLYYNPPSPPDIYTPTSKEKHVNYLHANDTLLIRFDSVTSATPGTWNMYGLVDCNGNVNESNETNNVRGPTTVHWLDPNQFPDLIIEDVQVSGYCPYVNESLYVDVTIANIGGMDADFFCTNFYYNRGTRPQAGYDCDECDDCWCSFYGLDAGARETFTFTVKNNPPFGTTWTMWLWVDPGNSVEETNENNNLDSIDIEWRDSPTGRLTSIYRNHIIENALGFTLNEWVCPQVNANPPNECQSWQSDYVIGSTYYGVPYEWGGCDDTTQFRCNLDKGQWAGALTGAKDICPLPPPPPGGGRGGWPWATGTECAGLVWHSLETNQYYTTTNLANVGLLITGGPEYLIKGDFLLIPGSHTFIFVNWARADSMTVIEAGDFRGIDDDDSSSEAREHKRLPSFYSGYSPYRYRYTQEVSGYDPTRAGDANSSGKVDVADIVYLVNYVFKFGPRPHPIWRGDANGDCKVNVSDQVYLVNYVFKGGPLPYLCSNCPNRYCSYP
jgi:hypothetical protein